MSKPLNLHAPVGTVAEKPGVGILVATGAGAPTASAVGYAKGCLYLDTTNAAVYQNTGTSSSATWTPRGAGAQSAALTASTGGTIDTTYGQAEADEISNLVTRVNEIEAALEAAGIVAAN